MSTSPLRPDPVRVARLWPVVSAAFALVLVVGLALVIVYREHNKPFGFELEWMGEFVEHRSSFWTVPALVFNALGGGLWAIVVVPAITIVGLLLFRRPWAALYFTMATAGSAAIVQLVKQLVGRPRPTDMLVHVDLGSFPSGHSSNAAVLATVLVIVFARTWIVAVGGVYTVAMMLSRVYLGVHWISDTVGGMLVGVGVAVIIWAPLANKLALERDAAHDPPWLKRHAKVRS